MVKILEVGLIQGTRYWEDVEQRVYWRKSIGVLDAIFWPGWPAPRFQQMMCHEPACCALVACIALVLKPSFDSKPIL